jgi:predicted DNA-binding protein YlxM (UPF0122 family)
MDTGLQNTLAKRESLVDKIKRLKVIQSNFQQELNLLESELNALISEINNRIDRSSVESILNDIKNS